MCKYSKECNNTELGVHVDGTDYCCPKKWEFGNITNGVCQKMSDVKTGEHWVGFTASSSSSDCSACGDESSCDYYPNIGLLCLFHSAN
jgi:hypothetical protein